ncbi:MAG: hypothetical protein R3D00_15305 [Bacteroidia bacterium]
MKRKRSILLILPNVVSLRDVIFTGLLNRLSVDFQVDIMCAAADKPNLRTYCEENGFGLYNTPEQKPGKFFAWLNPWLLAWVHWFGKQRIARKGNIHTIQTEMEAERHRSPLKYYSKYLLSILFFQFSPFFNLLLKAYKTSLDTSESVKLLAEISPATILIFDIFAPTHQHVIAAAEKTPFPMVAWIRSWDNLSAKGVILYHFHRYLVWNDIMREELLTYYDHIPETIIDVIGGLVFDYHIRFLEEPEPESFLYREQIHGKKVITFMLNYPDLSPGYLEDVKTILAAIEDGKFGENTLFIVRIQPGPRSEGQFDKLKPFENRILIDRWPANPPDFSLDAWMINHRHFCQLVQYSDVLINYPSTTTIDGAIYDVPSVTISFDGDGEKPYNQSVSRISKRTHYVPLANCGGNIIANSPEELTAGIQAYLENPQLHQEERKLILERMCAGKVGKVGKEVASLMADLYLPTSIHTNPKHA